MILKFLVAKEKVGLAIFVSLRWEIFVFHSLLLSL